MHRMLGGLETANEYRAAEFAEPNWPNYTVALQSSWAHIRRLEFREGQDSPHEPMERGRLHESAWLSKCLQVGLTC